MSDARAAKLAEILVHYSCALAPGDKLLIESFDAPLGFVNLLVRTAVAAGAQPLVQLKSQAVLRELLLGAEPDQLRVMAEAEARVMSQVAAYIGIRGGENVAELADVPAEKMRLYESLVFRPVHLELRVKRTRWVILRWPTAAMAQLAGRPTAAFEDFFFRVCTLDYARMSRALLPLQELMQATDRVRLLAPGTDLRFSIRGIPAVACDGRNNLPDGEVFTAPVAGSVEGTIRYNAASIYRGVLHEHVTFRFERGRIVEADSSNPRHLAEILDTDPGARSIGEFAIAFNPHITSPIKDILFDEKIAGSIHLTPGNCYDEASNGNQSQVHWDLVLMMAPEHGGGEIWFDDRLVRRDGRFVLPELAGLNPENLV